MSLNDDSVPILHEIGKLYDYDGTSNHQICKVYDNDGTSSYLVYNAEYVTDLS